MFVLDNGDGGIKNFYKGGGGGGLVVGWNFFKCFFYFRVFSRQIIVFGWDEE